MRGRGEILAGFGVGEEGRSGAEKKSPFDSLLGFDRGETGFK